MPRAEQDAEVISLFDYAKTHRNQLIARKYGDFVGSQKALTSYMMKTGSSRKRNGTGAEDGCHRQRKVRECKFKSH